MNIFNSYESILGEVDVKHLKTVTQEFLDTATFIRNRLGVKSYYLDKYLSDLLKAIDKSMVHDTADDGVQLTCDLVGLIRDIVKEENQKTDHPFYKTAKEYINKHPLAFQEYPTKCEYYLFALSDDYLIYAYPKYYNKFKERICEELDLVHIRHNFLEISEILGSQSQMEKLNYLLKERFIVSNVMSSFVQGFTDITKLSMSWRDIESSRTVLQLWFDNNI